MKKAKILSLLLAAVMLLSLIPAVGLTATADGSATTNSAPDFLPDGASVSHTKTWVNWASNNDGSYGTVDKNASNYTVTKTTDNSQAAGWGYNSDFVFIPENDRAAWRGASGIMFYATQGDADKITYTIRLQSPAHRYQDVSGNTKGSACLVSSPVVGSTKLTESGQSTSYYYNDTSNQWEEVNTYLPQYYPYEYAQSTYGEGWYYIPFTSFYYAGINGKSGEADGVIGKYNFYDWMNYFENPQLNALFIYSMSVGNTFGDLYLVYPEIEDTSSQSSAANIFNLQIRTNSWAMENSAAYTVSGQSVTVTGMQGNSETVSENRICLANDNAEKSITGATGIRFHVDTSALGDAALRLRVRLQSAAKPNAITNTIYAQNSNGYLTSTNESALQYVCRFANSVAYYYDANGVAKPLYINDPTNAEGDLFEALPVGYVGDIFIPMDSFGVSFGSYNNALLLPQKYVTDNYKLWQVLLCGAYTGTADEDKVIYSNFQVMYANTAINSTSVTLSDSLNLNVFVKQEAFATNVGMNYTFGEDSGAATLTKDGDLYKFSYEILPQQMAEKLDLSFTAQMTTGESVAWGSGTRGDKIATQTVSISVAEYLNKLLQGAPSGNLQKLIADMLNYGAAAQKIAGGAAITTIGGGTTVTERTATVAKNLTTSTDAGKSFASAAIRLESAVALRLNLNLDTTENVTVKVTLNGREQTFTGDELAAKTILYTDIKATEYDDAITATISVGDDVKQTLTYSVNTYLAALNTADADYDALADAVWAYGQSASAYAAAPDAGN